MAVDIKVRGTRSWLDNRVQPLLGAVLRDRLLMRCADCDGVMITLTYRRDGYDGPLDQYRRQGEEQHVPMFMRRLAWTLDKAGFNVPLNASGPTLAGRWMRKMEFQQGGWVHFHLILLGWSFIPHGLVESCWGHGHVWVSAMDEDTIRYACKYISKGGEPPAFLLAEKPRSVKIISASPGFWTDTKPGGSDLDEDEDVDPWSRLPIWKPIGLRISQASSVLICYDVGRKRFDQVAADLGETLNCAHRTGIKCSEGRPGWVRFHCSIDTLKSLIQSMRVAGESGEGGAGEAGPPLPIHLIQNTNPDRSYPAWLQKVLSAEYDEEPEWWPAVTGDISNWHRKVVAA